MRSGLYIAAAMILAGLIGNMVLGDPGYVRAAIRDRHAADRLLWALGEALMAGGRGPEPA